MTIHGIILWREFTIISNCRFIMAGVLLLVSLQWADTVTAADSSLNGSSLHASENSATQSLLFRIDADGLHLTRRDVLDDGLKTRAPARTASPGVADQSTAKSATHALRDLRALRALRLDSSRSLQQPTDQTLSPELQTAVPHAEWLDSDGMTIAVTQFTEPRIARVPQQGQLIHEAVLGQATAYFLVRGPAAAVRVNIFLPDLGFTDSLGLQNQVTRTGQTANKIDAQAATQAFRQSAQQDAELKDVLQKQNWQLDLPQ